MNKTKDQQAQEYVLNRQTARHNAKTEEEATMADFDKTRKVCDAYDMEQAFEDGYTAAEQSMWRSVEEEEPPIGKLILCRNSNEASLAYYDGEDMCEAQNDGVLNMPYWMPIPSLPDTNTEKK